MLGPTEGSRHGIQSQRNLPTTARASRCTGDEFWGRHAIRKSRPAGAIHLTYSIHRDGGGGSRLTKRGWNARIAKQAVLQREAMVAVLSDTEEFVRLGAAASWSHPCVVS